MARLSNPNLKRAGQKHEYTAEMVLEIKKCAQDPNYFIKTYCMIQHPKKGVIPFSMYDYQEKMVTTYKDNRFVIVLSARQTGKSTTSGAFILWYAMFHFDKTVLIASNKNSNAMEMIHRIRLMYEYLPHWLKPGLTDDGWNKHNVVFENGSRIISTATTEEAGRGMSISLLFLDEFAFVRPNVQEEFWTSMEPTLATGGSCIITSTPNGDSNRFAEMWRGANSPISIENSSVGVNGFAPIHVRWDEPPGRDDRFKKGEIAKIGELRWRQEYECEFLSSDALLVDTVALARITPYVEQVQAFGVMDEIVWYKEPMPHTTYLVGLDPATGNGRDNSAIEVFEFPSMDQVAEYRSNTMSPAYIYTRLKRVLTRLHKCEATAYYTVENNGAGQAIIALMEADENPPETAEFISETGKNKQGMVTTARSKVRACIAMKEMIERGALVIRSRVLLKELKEFVRKRHGYEARSGSTDDQISALLLVVRLVEEMSQFDQDAYDVMYSYAFEGEEGYNRDDEDYDDNDIPPAVVF